MKTKRKTVPSKAKRKATPGRRAAKDIAQFAPNFTVYVLPPDQVCLYSEDRKFFLHGELYCELATTIGKGGKSLQQLAVEFGKRFPPEKVEEALKRLIERRYIVEASPTSNTVQAAKEFTKALAELGVHVVIGRGAADLTITLANDYLEPRLAELNKQHVSDG